MPVGGVITGNYAVIRVARDAPDYGRAYAYWHEDYADRGLEFLAENIADYCVLGCQSFVDTLRDEYGGPACIW
jgi:hypothetical protein